MTKGHQLLTEAMLRLKLTQTEVAARVGVSQGAVSDWESGKKIPRLPSALRLAAVLEIPVESWGEPLEHHAAEG